MINDRIRVRNAIIPSKVLTAEEKKWVMRTPKDIRAHSVFQAVAAFKVGFSQLRSGVTNNFDVQFRSRKRSRIAAPLCAAKFGIRIRNERSFALYPDKMKNCLTESEKKKRRMQMST